jgi:protein-L-isoaspartate(D-aspartate) O-methyltransferase
MSGWIGRGWRRVRAGIFAVSALVVALPSTALTAPAADDAAFRDQRQRMVREIERHAEYAGAVAGRDRLSPAVLAIMGEVPRHAFVPDDQRRHAYEDRPLPIGYGQTISQPYIVALMTDLLDLERDDKVLEVGTGSGYQAAVLAGLAGKVFTIEIVPPLATAADARLSGLGFDTVTVRQGDGYYGWEDHAPFDAIMVTAAASHVPPPLLRQLRPGGRMVIPVGAAFFVQQLLLITKDDDGRIVTRHVLPVRFVPLTGSH